MYPLKKITVLFIMAFFSTCAIHAQDFKNASKLVLSKIHSQEINELSIDINLLCIPDNQNRVEYKKNNALIKVGKLLYNGDYSKYYKDKDTIRLTQNFWVFIPKEVKEKCTQKGINNSARMCSFLGLDNKAECDTIVFFWVDRNRLFRPAYNSDITKPVQQSSVLRSIDHSNSEVRKWFDMQSKTNNYPWTRLGYTYDYGDPQNPIGATEFVTQTGFYAVYDSYQTVTEFLSNN